MFKRPLIQWIDKKNTFTKQCANEVMTCCFGFQFENFYMWVLHLIFIFININFCTICTIDLHFPLPYDRLKETCLTSQQIASYYFSIHWISKEIIDSQNYCERLLLNFLHVVPWDISSEYSHGEKVKNFQAFYVKVPINKYCLQGITFLYTQCNLFVIQLFEQEDFFFWNIDRIGINTFFYVIWD